MFCCSISAVMDIHSFMCNGRRILLPLDVMPMGHTYSLGFTQMQAPTSTRRRAGAYVLYVGPGTTTPVSQLGIHEDLVTFGGFTPETARLALVDGQPPPNFARPVLPWVQAVPMHTPALGYSTFPAASILPQVFSCSSSSSTTASISTASTQVVAAPPIAQLTPMPQFEAIVVPPVITFNPSPPPRPTAAVSSYQVLSVPLSPISTDAPSTATPTTQLTSHAPSTPSTSAPILQWPSFVTATMPASMPRLDPAPGPFPELLGVAADNSTTTWPSPSASPSSRPPTHPRSSSRLRGVSQPHPYFLSSPRRQPTATQSVAPRASPSPPARVYSPVRAPTRSVYGGPLWSDYRPPSPTQVAAPPQVASDSSSSSDDDTR